MLKFLLVSCFVKVMNDNFIPTFGHNTRKRYSIEKNWSLYKIAFGMVVMIC